MVELKLRSRNMAGEIMEEIINRIEQENLKWDYSKFDALFFIIEFLGEQQDLFEEAYKNKNWSQIRDEFVLSQYK